MLTNEEKKVTLNIMKQGVKVLIDTPNADDVINTYMLIRGKIMQDETPQLTQEMVKTLVDANYITNENYIKLCEDKQWPLNG